MVTIENKPHPEAVVNEPPGAGTGPELASDGMAFEYPPPPVVPAPPAPTEPAPAQRPIARLFVPFLLISLGIFFLIGNVLTIGGGAFFIGLGLVFLAARVIWNNYGLAVPAGILLGFGGYVALAESGWITTGQDTAAGGWFFLMLALGFVAAYLIGARPGLIWPFFPAAALAAFGLLLLGSDYLEPFARFADYGKFWPVALIVVGGYILLRDYLPSEIRRPLALIGTLALVGYGLLVLAGGLARADLQIGDIRSFGVNAPISHTDDLAASLGENGLVRITNVSGRTIVQTGAAGIVQVRATKYLWADDQNLDIKLMPVEGALTLVATPGAERYFGNRPYADFVVTVPVSTRIEVTSSSGSIEVRGVAGAVTATSVSGSVTLDEIGGPVEARSSSGSLRLTNITGDLRAVSSSGSIRATGIARPREVTTSSGSIALDGAFTGDATIKSSSGSVTVGFAPGSAARIVATSSSGTVRTRDLDLADRSEGAHRLSGTLGLGAGNVAITTSSGAITLTTAK